MRYFLAKDLIPGMVVARTIISEDGTTLLERGLSLSASQIENIQNRGILSLYITSDETSQEFDDLSPTIFLTKAAFMVKYETAIQKVKNVFTYAQHYKHIPVGELRNFADEIIVPLTNSIGVFEYMYEMKQHCDDTFQHSLNVSIVTGVLGKWGKYAEKAQSNLVLAGLMHDIGKVCIPPPLLHKPGILSESEFNTIKKHSEEGYALVKETAAIDDEVKLAILQHHERLDGSGYPIGLKADKIHEYAKIVAVSDIYDAMTSDRAYRPRLTPFTAMEAICGQMHDKLDLKICLPFIDNMRDRFIGSSVLLSNGQRASVILLPNLSWTKPLVRTHTDGLLLDLAREEKVHIVDLV